MVTNKKVISTILAGSLLNLSLTGNNLVSASSYDSELFSNFSSRDILSSFESDSSKNNSNNYFVISQQALDDSSKAVVNLSNENAELKQKNSNLEKELDNLKNPGFVTKVKNKLLSLLKYGFVGVVAAMAMATYMDRTGHTNVFSKYLNKKIYDKFSYNDIVTIGIKMAKSGYKNIKSMDIFKLLNTLKNKTSDFTNYISSKF